MSQPEPSGLPRHAHPEDSSDPSTYRRWWNRLTPGERLHTRACVEADEVDEEMLDIFTERGPVGVYGVRWAGDATTFLSGGFVDFVKTVPRDPQDDDVWPTPA